MKPDKLDKLFTAVARADSPKPETDFAADVMRAIQREAHIAPPTLTEQIAALLPRVAFAAALLIAVCFAADLALDSLGDTSLSGGLTQISEQWLFAAN